MPRTKLDIPKYPPIDVLKACILERKMVMHMSWDDIAAKTNTSGAAIRKMVCSKHTEEWDPNIRRKICRELGLTLETTVKVKSEDGGLRL